MPAPPAPTLPYRHLARLQSEYHLAALEPLYAVLPGQFARGILFQSIARVCVGDWIGDGVFRAPAVPVATTSMRAVALSLHRPFETVRRSIVDLLDQGLCVAHGSGMALNPHGPGAALTCAYYAGTHDHFLTLIARIRDFGLALPVQPAAQAPAPACGPGYPLAGLIRKALDLSLEPLDTFRITDWNWSTMLLWMAVSALNVRHVTFDAALSHRYAVDYTPDTIRRPVSLHAVAKLVQLPYGTAWRYAAMLEEAGLMVRSDQGWLIASKQLHDDRVRDTMILHSDHLMQRVRAAVRDGLDPAQIEQSYLTTRS